MNNQNPYGAGGGGGFGPGGGGGGGGAYPAPGGGGGGAGSAPGQLDVADVFSTTFRAIGGALVPVLGCALIVAVPTLVTSFLIRVAMYLILVSSESGPPTMETLQQLALLGSLAYVAAFGVLIVTQSIGQAGIVYAVAEYLSGRKATLGGAIRVGFSRLVPVVVASFIVGIVIVIGLIMCLLPGLVAIVFFCMTVPVCVVERLGPIDSITRGIQLAEGNRLQITLAFLALVVGIFVVSCCIIGPIAGIGGAIGASGQLSGDPHSLAELYNPLSPAQLLTAIAQIPTLIVQTMVSTTFVAVIYARLRGLRDGVDAQAIASVFT